MTEATKWTAARERVAKFVTEWPKGSHRGDMIHGLHMGCPREAELRLSDIKALLDQSAASPDMAEALDPETLEAIADEIECFEHSARCASLRGIAKRQRAALAKAGV